MAKKYRKVRFSIIALTLVVIVGGIGAVAAIQLTKDPDYWLGGITLVVTVTVPLLGMVMRESPASSRGRLDEVEEELRVAVLVQWSEDVKRRVGNPYPLPVPFSVLTKAKFTMRSDDEDEGEVETTVDIMDGWPAIRGKRDAGPLPLDGTFNAIAKVFTKEGLPRRLVVLGEPGSGKSMIAQWLTLELLEADQERKVVPVFLPIATWNPDTPLMDWAATQMAQTYRWLSAVMEVKDGKEKTLAQELIAENRVLMILDGLDEIPETNQSKALDKLSEFAEGDHHFVVTCRTADYAKIVYGSENGPLAKTPVLAMGRLPIADVIQYLRDTVAKRSPDRWSGFLRHLETEPDGALATALSTSLSVWLVRSFYRKPQNEPGKLLTFGSEEEITQLLLKGLVDAVYSTKIGDREAQPDAEIRKAEEERLTYFANYLAPRAHAKTKVGQSKDNQSIEWWHLPETVPKAFIAGTVGTIVGSVLGASVGLASAIKLGSHVGLIVGIVFAFLSGAHAGSIAVRWQDDPRTIGISFKLSFQRVSACLAVGVAVGLSFGYAADTGGGPTAGLITAVLVGPACTIGIWPTFGKAPALGTGVTGGIALGVAAWLSERSSTPLVSGVVAGVVFVVSAWIFTGLFQSAKSAIAASPESLLRDDRNGSFVVALTAGVAFGVIFGLAMGPLMGVVAFFGLTIAASLTVSMWGAFTFTRIWLAMFRKMPMDIMGFLQEAQDRGVLRRVGGAYQFRHTKLQERLTRSQQ